MGMWVSYSNIPKAIVHLLKGDYRPYELANLTFFGSLYRTSGVQCSKLDCGFRIQRFRGEPPHPALVTIIEMMVTILGSLKYLLERICSVGVRLKFKFHVWFRVEGLQAYGFRDLGGKGCLWR